MSKHKLIPYPVIAAAVRGAPEAANRVLDHYSGYIAVLSIRKNRKSPLRKDFSSLKGLDKWEFSN